MSSILTQGSITMSIIKPLEEKNYRPSMYKIFFLVTLIATGVLLDKIFLKKLKDTPSILGKTQEIKSQTQEEIVKKVQESNLVKDTIKKAEEGGGVVLGEAKSFVSNVIYDNSIGKVIDQVDKLPKDQQEKIREQICK